MILVDIPGNSDTNAARDSLAKRIMRDLSVVCVLAPATRAVDNNAAHELMSCATQRNFQLDGKWNSEKLCFLVVRTDESLVERSYINKYPEVRERLWEVFLKVRDCRSKQEMLRQEIKNAEDRQDTLSEELEDLNNCVMEEKNRVGTSSMPATKKRKLSDLDGAGKWPYVK